jgi:hypothetical protein
MSALLLRAITDIVSMVVVATAPAHSDDVAIADDADTAATTPTEPPPPAAAREVAPPPDDDEHGEKLGFIERMPASAFSSPRVRGIEGGSLWMTSHGLQWPYFPHTGIGVSGYAWVDSGYETIRRGNSTEQGIDYWLQQGRVLLRVTPTYTSGNFFVQGQAELVVNKDQSLRQPDIADTDDLWLKIGSWKKWDVQFGRYEGWEVYHFGMGLDLNTLERQGASDEAFGVPGIYGVTYAFYRPASVGQAAIHVYPTEWLRFELGTQFGNEFGSNALATRPVAVLDLGWLKLKAGGEFKRLSDQHEGSKGYTDSRGGGGSIQLVFDPRLEFGVSGAYGLVDRVAQDGTVDEKGSNTTYSVGAFANLRVVGDLIVGGGVNYTYLEDTHYDPALMRVEDFKHTQTFGAIQYLIAKHLYVKAVMAYAKADFAPTFGDPVFADSMLSGRVRMMYLF